MTGADVARALGYALTLAAQGYSCFPCAATKRPATPHGFLDAQTDPRALRKLWLDYPAPLVGVPTGAGSGLDALDLDAKHSEATRWWLQNRHRVPETRTHRTRSRGLHLFFRHAPGLRCWTGRPVVGIDGRADGGFILWWPATGLPVLCHAPPMPWPAWLLDELKPLRSEAVRGAWTPPTDPRYRAASYYASAALRHAADRIASAPIGARNQTLNEEAYGIGRLVNEGLLDSQELADTLAGAAISGGLAPLEIAATLRSAFRARGLL